MRVVVCVVQEECRLKTRLEGERALQCARTGSALRRMGSKIGFSPLRIDQQLAAKGETVHGLCPLREADSAWIPARTSHAQQIFRVDDQARMAALQRTDTVLQRIVLTKRSLRLVDSL